MAGSTVGGAGWGTTVRGIGHACCYLSPASGVVLHWIGEIMLFEKRRPPMDGACSDGIYGCPHGAWRTAADSLVLQGHCLMLLAVMAMPESGAA